MRLIVVALLSCLAGTAVGLGLLYAGGEPVGVEDLLGFGGFIFAPALLCCALFYAPGLFWLRRRRGGCRPPHLFVLASALVLNLPAFAFVAAGMLMRNFSGAGEAALFLCAFAAAGFVFGLGFVRHCRRGEARPKPSPAGGGVGP